MKKSICFLFVVILSVCFFSQITPAHAANLNANTVYTFNITGTADYNEANDVVARLNSLRASLGLSRVTHSTALTNTAMQRAAETAIFWSHTRPDGSDLRTTFPNGITWTDGNIAVGYTSGASVMAGWTNSPGHYRYMTQTYHTAVGIGCFYQPNGRRFWFMLFSGATGVTPSTRTGTQTTTFPIRATGSNLSIQIQPSTSTIHIGNPQQLGLFNTVNRGWSGAGSTRIDPAFFTSSNTGIATVNLSGLVTGVSRGSAQIRLGFSSSIFWERTVTVTQTYTVTFRDGDRILRTETVEHGRPATAPANPWRTGHTFDGWDRAFNNVTENLTVNAKWKINTYTVTFRDGDTIFKTDTVEHGSAATAPADPKKTGFTFDGWDRTFSNIIRDLIVNARWSFSWQPTATPRLAGNVTITGTMRMDRTVSANTSGLKRSGGVVFGTLRYQWHRNGNAISGATNSSYKLKRADVGRKITVSVTASNYTGRVTSASRTVRKLDQKRLRISDGTTTGNLRRSVNSSNFRLTARGGSGNGKLTWTSSNRKVATINSNGRVRIRGSGTTTITVTKAGTRVYSARNAKIRITVTP